MIGSAIAVLIILLIIFWRASLIFVFKSGTLIKLRICFITITLFDSEKKKRPKKRKYTKKALERRQKKLEKTLKKKRKKAPEANTSKTEKKKKRPRFKFPDDVEDLLSLLSSFFGDFLRPIVRNARVRFKYFRLTVASPDPADTAIRYGILSQSTAYFLQILAENTKISKRQLKKVCLDCNFLEEKTTLELHMIVSFSIWKLIFLLARGGLRFFEKLEKFRSKNNTDTKNKKKIEGHKVS